MNCKINFVIINNQLKIKNLVKLCKNKMKIFNIKMINKFR